MRNTYGENGIKEDWVPHWGQESIAEEVTALVSIQFSVEISQPASHNSSSKAQRLGR